MLEIFTSSSFVASPSAEAQVAGMPAVIDVRPHGDTFLSKELLENMRAAHAQRLMARDRRRPQPFASTLDAELDHLGEDPMLWRRTVTTAQSTELVVIADDIARAPNEMSAAATFSARAERWLSALSR